MSHLSRVISKTYCFCLTVFLLAIAQISQSQSITLDSGFNGIGWLNVGYNQSDPNSDYRSMVLGTLAVQGDGKMIIGGTGHESLFLCRYNLTGTLDSSFGINGISAVLMTRPRVEPMRIRVLSDGKIMLLGQQNNSGKYVLYRYHHNGQLDQDFGDGGKTTLDLPSPGAVISFMEIQADGKVLLAGDVPGSAVTWPGFYLARFDPNGSIDHSFGQGGEVKSHFNFIPSDPLNGQLFHGDSRIRDFAIQPDGKIVACGTLSAYGIHGILSDSMLVVRYNRDGSFDRSFSDDGKFSFDFPNADNPVSTGSRGKAISLQPDGKIVVGGVWHRYQIRSQWEKGAYVLWRLLSNGILDFTFDDDGVKVYAEGFLNVPFKAFVQADERILMLGHEALAGQRTGSYLPQFSMIRVNRNGQPDVSFGPDGVWPPLYYNNTEDRLVSGAPDAEMKGQRLYLFGGLPQSNEESIGGPTLFVFKMDGVAANPKTNTLCGQGTATTIISDLKGNTYQWQVSTDSINFTNVINDVHYSGSNSSALSIKDIPAAWNGYRFRCITEKSTSNATTIQFLKPNENEWTGSADNSWENPANWLCGTVPNSNSIVFIPAGNVKIHSNVTVKEIRLQPGASLVVDPGYSVVLAPGL